MSYIELHCRSVFSLLEGASEPEALLARAKALGMTGLALTDRDDLGGAVRFAQAARELHLAGILGAELSLAIDDVPAPLVLLAESREGYGNIASLITRARMDHPRGEPRVSLDLLAQHTRGVFALTGGPRGWVPACVAAGRIDAACEATATLLDIFEGRVAIECWDHHLPEERSIVRQLVPLARSLGIPWVVTNDVCYAHPTGRIVHDVLLAIKHRETLDGMGTRLRPNGEWYLKSAAQMRRRWQGAEEGIRATLTIAERCAFRLEHMRPTLPDYPLPPGVSADEYLERLVEQGAVERWGHPSHDGAQAQAARTRRAGSRDVPRERRQSGVATGGLPSGIASLAELPERYARQISHELGVIRRLGLAGYFLIVWDIVRFANREGVLCQGRGSAANSAVCYCLGITAIDPIRMELLFERFLSEDRQEAPDIDIDFAHRDREKVLQYVYERYGREHAAMVCEQITYRGRSAVRDAAKVLGFSEDQASVLSTLSDRFSAKSTAEALRAGATATEMLGRHYDLDPQSDRPGLPDDARKHPEEWTAEKLLAHRRNRDAPHDAEVSSRARGDSVAARRVAAAHSGRPDILRGVVPDGRPSAVAGALAPRRRRPAAAGSPPSGDGPGNQATPSSPGSTDPPLHGPVDRDPATMPHTVPEAGPGSMLAQAGLDPRDRRVQALPEIVAGLHQAPRHRSIHVGGFVLTAEPLSTVVPIEPASMPGRTVIQWERDDLDAAGLVKIDLLGLGMLTVLQDCLKYIRATRGVTIDLARLDLADQAVYDDLCAADTIGVFQVESRAQMNTLPRLKPRSFYDLVVEVALIRPGPIQGEMVHPYLRRRAGEEAVTYPHPSVEPILRRTLGVPLFQEQGMQVAIVAAGFTPGEADTLRRAMGHKRSHERMAAICEKLIAGMRRNGIPEDIARRIYNQINAFADYGFPESHSASFALIVYASAYLRHYYAAEFTAAILNAQPMGFYSVGTLIEDARRHGVTVRPVDLTRSAWDHALEMADGTTIVPYDGVVQLVRRMPAGEPTTIEQDAGQDERVREPRDASGRRNERAAEMARGAPPNNNDTARHSPPPHHFHADPITPSPPPARPPSPAVRLGLRTVRGLGAAAREILEAALRDGPFKDIPDVVRRARLDRGALRALCEAGAFDRMVADVPVLERRRVALWRLLDAVRGDAGPLAPQPHRQQQPGGDGRHLPPMSPLELTDADYRLTGLSLAGHPMRHLRELLAPNGIRTARDLLRSGRDDERVALAGLVICRQRPGTAKGFVFLSIEDETGIVNVVVTPKRFERQALLISSSPLLLIRGTLQVESNVVNLRGEEFRALRADAGEHWAKGHNFH
ncbi:MAG: Error-prone DNA polymerase [Gemmatimonadaceae bacterium]|nr:Error-prone DNA polymerase [Gemmatimonadaceae bacterium]